MASMRRAGVAVSVLGPTLADLQEIARWYGMNVVFGTWEDASRRRRVASGVAVTMHTRGIGDEMVAKYVTSDTLTGAVDAIREPQWVYVKFDSGYRIAPHLSPTEWRFYLDGEQAHPSDDPNVRWAHLGDFKRKPSRIAAKPQERHEPAATSREPEKQRADRKPAKRSTPRVKKSRETDYDRVIAALFSAADTGEPVIAGGVVFASGYFKSFYGALIDVFQSLGSTRQSLDENIGRGSIAIVGESTFGVMGLDVAKARLPASLSPSESHGSNLIEYAVRKDVSLR